MSLYRALISLESPVDLIVTLAYEGLLWTKYQICIYPCYVAYMNAMHNKSISKHICYKQKVSDKTKRYPIQLKDV